jgi:hypothetical protein
MITGDYSNLTRRETVATILNDAEELRVLGLPLNNVHDADAVEEPDSTDFPLLVIRWFDVVTKMAHVEVQPFDLWVYDSGSDRTRAEAIARAAAVVLAGEDGRGLNPIKKLGGYITEITDQGQGADMTDDNFDAVVVPRRLTAVGSGL